MRRKKETTKNPGLAAVLSFLWPGLGQIYNGQIAEGIGIMTILIIIAGLIVYLVIGTSSWMILSEWFLIPGTRKTSDIMWMWDILTGVLALSYFIILVFQIASAYRKAEEINQSVDMDIEQEDEDLTGFDTGLERICGKRANFKRWYER